MTYLALCQEVVRRAGVAGANRGAPDTLQGATGRLAQIADFVQEACLLVESEWTDWTYRSVDIDMDVPPGADRIDPRDTGSDVERISAHAVFARDEVERRQLVAMSWASMRRLINAQGPAVTTDLPTQFAIDPAGVIHFASVRDEDWLLRAECVLRPTTLRLDDDEPLIPADFHDLIVHGALVRYHESEEAFDLMSRAESAYQAWMTRLEAACLPGSDYSRTYSPEVPLIMRTY